VLHILWSIIVGFVVGLIARVIVRILGSIVGGFIGRIVSKPPEGSKFHPAGFFLSLVGAIVLLLIWGFAVH
jgi:uncharacterized membrane protein YeaQ/YmgE (transglycosylase-associated protein family)